MIKKAKFLKKRTVQPLFKFCKGFVVFVSRGCEGFIEGWKLKSESTKVFCDGILRRVGVLSNFLQIEYKIKS